MDIYSSWSKFLDILKRNEQILRNNEKSYDPNIICLMVVAHSPTLWGFFGVELETKSFCIVWMFGSFWAKSSNEKKVVSQM